MIRHFFANCRQLEMFLFDERIFGCFSKLLVMGCLVPRVTAENDPIGRSHLHYGPNFRIALSYIQ